MEACPPEHLTVETGPGRVETRRIWTSAVRNDSVTFPYAAPGACGARDIVPVRQATTTRERVSLLSSRSRAEASPAQVLALNRRHGGIENRLHHIRNRADAEDRGRARTGQTPRVRACLRTVPLSLLRLFQGSNITAAWRDWAAQANTVLNMFRL